MCKSVAMRRAHHLLFGFGLSLSLSGCFDHEPPIIEMMFGSTEFIYNAEGPAKDYIPNFPDTILHTASRCEVELIGFNGSLSEGAEIAIFKRPKILRVDSAVLSRPYPRDTSASSITRTGIRWLRKFPVFQCNWRQPTKEFR